MIWRFDFQSEIPLYQQIRSQVLQSIAAGALQPGDQLPTIRALSQESGINMMTISKAYQLLKAEGYVSTDRRKGTVVADAMPKRALSPESEQLLRTLLLELRLQGMKEEEILDLCRSMLNEKEAL